MGEGNPTARRRRGPGRPVLENLRNAGPPLGEGEKSQTHRIRAADDLHEWFGAMTAEQRGHVIARAKAAQEAVKGSAEGAQAQEPETAPEVTVQLVEAVTLGTLPPRDVEPKPHHAPILKALRDGGTLTRAPGEVWRLVGGGEQGRTIKAETVRVMLRDGWLSRADPIPLKVQADDDQGEAEDMQHIGARVS
ncbi:hypothetical protein V3W47_19470 [Deinococcus sp. YIM 134068]|uniref:hypothetical protein n=1 Tax=Deinococcus lichenicola TaxID=3118910 RepID=UPI002F92EF63